MTSTHVNALKTHCPSGHPLSGDNARIIKRNSPMGFARACRSCERERSAAKRRDPIKGAIEKQRCAAYRERMRRERAALGIVKQPYRPRVVRCALPAPKPAAEPSFIPRGRVAGSTPGVDAPGLNTW